MICLMFSMLFRSIWQCSELLTFYWLPLPLPAPIPRIVRANSGILLAGIHSPGATGTLAETRILSGIISTNIRSRHGLTVRPRENFFYQFCLDLYGMTFIFYVIFCPMVFKFFKNFSWSVLVLPKWAYAVSFMKIGRKVRSSALMG